MDIAMAPEEFASEISRIAKEPSAAGPNPPGIAASAA